jgi:hypothetical protein
MTSIPLSALPTAVKDEARRDRWGRYLARRPGGDVLVPHTRVTTAAKSLDNGGGLAEWKASLAIAGVIGRRGLRSQWEALLASTGGNAWYAGVESKKRCKALVEECAAAGGADERKDTGTSLHTMTALLDLGRDLGHLTAETERDLEAYRKCLAEGGIEIVPGLIERTVVLDDYLVAGTFDRGVTAPSFSSPLVADLKCGADLSYSWQSIAVQLAAYSRADAIYVQGSAPDGSEDQRLPMPDFDQEHGLIIWCNAGTGECSLHLVDLVAGWEGFELSMAARAWRKRDVSMPFAPGVRFSSDQLAEQLEASVAHLAANAQVGDGPGTGTRPSSPGAVASSLDAVEQVDADLGLVDQLPPTADEGSPAEVRAWLQRRIDAIGARPSAAAELARTWPSGVSTLKRSAEHTPEQLEVIEKVCWRVEKLHQIRFPEPKPGVDLMALIESQFPGTTDAIKEQ